MIIYKLTNKINGTIYIGQTILLLKQRIKNHLYGKKISRIYRALRFYGIDNFTQEILKECFSKKEMDKYEKLFIKLYNSKTPNGYNLTDGGEGTLGWIPTEECRKKISAKKKGVKYSKEVRERMKAGKIIKRGKDSPIYGRHSTEEQKRKNSEAHKGAKNPMYGKKNPALSNAMKRYHARKKEIQCIILK